MGAAQLFNNRGMDKQNVVYTDRKILFSVRQEVLTHATTWMDLDVIILSEISQSQKVKCCIISLI